jgi:hypothetical protein
LIQCNPVNLTILKTYKQLEKIYFDSENFKTIYFFLLQIFR